MTAIVPVFRIDARSTDVHGVSVLAGETPAPQWAEFCDG